jgi:hypothetical protein
VCFQSKQPSAPVNPAPYPLEESDKAVIETSNAAAVPTEQGDGAGTPETVKIDGIPENQGAGEYPFKM